MLELINRARLDPVADFNAYITNYNPAASSNPDINSALSFFHVNGPVLLAQINALTPVAPVAWSSALADAAAAHSQLMITNDSQSHQLPGEGDLGARTTAAGFTGFSVLGENVFAFTESILQGHAGFMVDWGNTASGIQTPPGHRTNILGASFKEVGLSVLTESISATSVGPLVVTQDFGARFGASGAFALGVSYNDTDGNKFYTEGEGRSGVNISFSRAGTIITTQTQTAGGYSQQIPAGHYDVRFSGAGLPAAMEVSLDAGASNIKLDVIDMDTIAVSVSFQLGSGALKGQLLGQGNGNITGNALANTLIGNAGANLLDGGAGVDTAQYHGARGTYVIGGGVTGRTVTDSIAGRDGADSLGSIERLQFSGGVLAFDNLRTDNAGRGYLIYRAAFDRVPDPPDLGYWIRELDRGQDYGAVVAASFIASPEFIALNVVMGQLSNAVKVVNNQMTFAEWESLHDNFMRQEKTKYDSMAASTLATKIPGVGWILAPVAKALFDVTVTEQITNSFEIRVSLDTFIPGGPKNNIVVGGNQKNQIKLGDGGSFASGGDSADTFAVGKGNDNISGGAGTDTVVFSSSRAAYGISKQANGMNKVTGPDGADLLSRVERLQFSDGVLAFNNQPTDNAGRGYLIYRAAFDRVPDAPGLGYWIRELDRGRDFGSVVAASFIASPEFIRLYGTSLSNSAFVNLVYQNVLDRGADTDGLNYWLNLAGGGRLNGGYARSNMLASFAISQENVTGVASLISDGIFFV